jgi:hypothetical protein
VAAPGGASVERTLERARLGWARPAGVPRRGARALDKAERDG